MFATLVSAGLTCVGALMIGQATLRLCGANSWSWLAPSVGLSVLMLVAIPALHVPGRSSTMAAVLAVLTVAACAWALRNHAMRPPVAGLLAGIPVALMALVPFAAAGRAGTLGVSFDNDMTSHLAWADAYRSEAIARITVLPGDYPLGPHAFVAALAQGLGIEVDAAFAGFTLALPVLLGWTAFGAMQRCGWLGRLMLPTLVGMPFILAGYYGQGSFKEIQEALFVLAVPVAIAGVSDMSPRWQWIPLAAIVAGTLSVYSFAGLVWPLAIVGLWLVTVAVLRLKEAPLRTVARDARGAVTPVILGGAVLFVALGPQLPRLYLFFTTHVGVNGTGIEKSNLGNVAVRLRLWEAFGIWDNPDYRLPPIDPLGTGVWVGLVVALVVFGATWAVRRGDWVVPIAAAASLIIFLLSDRTQSPYVAAKALVILSPLLVLVAVRPLVERAPRDPPSWWRVAAPVLAAVLLVKMGGSSLEALRYSTVGPKDHLRELRELRPLLHAQPTLFLGNDDFIPWELAGVPVAAPVIGFVHLPTRPEKPWAYGQALDFDSVDAATINHYDWVIATRDAAASTPPPELKLFRETRSYALYRRVGRVTARKILREGQASGVVLDCRRRAGRRLARTPGVAGIRTPPVVVEAAPVAPGKSAEVTMKLGSGAWDLVAPYLSPRPIEVRAPGIHTDLPANLDRPGPRLPVGRLELRQPTTVRIQMYVRTQRLTPSSAVAYPGAFIATKAERERVVSLSRACGHLVDWYLPRRADHG